MRSPLLIALTFACFGIGSANAGWKAGVAQVAITPDEWMWMSGYGSRDHVAEGKETELWAKALLLEDDHGSRVLAITLDLVGIDRDTSAAIKQGIQHQLNLPPGQVALLCSHTHCGPVVGTNLMSMYSLDDAERAKVESYTKGLIAKLVDLATAASLDATPAEVSFGSGQAMFAVNRRANKEPDVPTLREKNELQGPVDHSVPVLKVTAKGRLKAVLFGYACHATTLSYYHWCGDYPGFAMLELEAAHPGAVALFWAGCGADQNPLPRRTVVLAKDYGHQLATAVEEVLAVPMPTIGGRIDAQSAEIPLPFAHLPGKAELEELAKSPNKYEVSRARHLLNELERNGKLDESYAYPVQTWILGDGPRWVMLGGEVVVDYALRIKAENQREPIWVAGYANDVMAYIPSLRVLKEGGYEGGGAMLYYGHPSPWNEEVEERIMKSVTEQLAKP